ncbi:MAG: recombination mediator RecR [Chitinophagaceae bacterium]
MNLPSQYMEEAFKAINALPGIGKKTALRLTMHLLKEDTDKVQYFCNAIINMRIETKFCIQCHNIADGDLCIICKNSARKKEAICVVENIRDLIALENTQQYNGLYHILGGVISPIEHISPDQLNIESLIKRIENEPIAEIVFALNPTIQGDTTIYYIQKRLQAFSHIKLSTIARGIAFGGELEYADELTLARSFTNRLSIDNYIERL